MTSAPTSQRSFSPRLLVGGAALLLVLISVVTATNSPTVDEPWRWATVALAAVNCGWNVLTAANAFHRTGPVSLVGFLHLWAFVAFSLPAAEMTFRYEQLSTGYWQVYTDTPLVFQAALLLFVFQAVFFLALGKGVDGIGVRLIEGSRIHSPQPRVGYIFLALLIPLILARLLVLRGLGLSGAATAAITRTDYFAQLGSGVSPLVWVLNTAFPVYAVVLGCLAVKFLIPHPSSLGRGLFVLVLIGSTGGVALSGGRAEIVLVSVTVGVFMYAAGYRTARQYRPLVVLGVLVAVLLFAVAQARHGEDNALSQAAGDAYVGNDYSSGDVTQILGLGRFDAMVMILDRHDRSDALMGSSYGGALVNGLDETFIPQIVAGIDFEPPTVSGDVLGLWVFGESQNSALPSAPGEGFINFGYAGIVLAALAIGLLTRGLVRGIAYLPGPQEASIVLVTWTMARLLSDESGLLMSFAVRNWPIVALALVLARHTTAQPRYEPVHEGSQR